MTSARSLHYYLWIMKIALFFKKPVMLYAQGIGPVRGIKARKAVQKVLQQVAVIASATGNRRRNFLTWA